MKFIELVRIYGCRLVGAAFAIAVCLPNVVTAQSLPPTGSTITPVPVTACRTINQSGSYVLSTSLITPANSSCITIQDTHDVSLDCQQNAITINREYASYSQSAIRIVNVTNYSVRNCGMIALNTSEAADIATLYTSGTAQGVIANNTFRGGYANITSDDTSVENNVSSAPIGISGNRVTVEGNRISLDPSKRYFWGLSLSYSSGSVVRNNSVNGGWDGSVRQWLDVHRGSDSGIILEQLMDTSVEDNVLSNSWNCGIESLRMLSNVKIRRNKITTAGVCGIGAWSANSMRSVAVADNTVTDAPRLLYFFRSGALHPETGEQFIYFEGNTFTGNVLTKPRVGVAVQGAAMIDFQNLVGGAPADALIAGNNVVAGNDFGPLPRFLSFLPSASISDGTGNICSAAIVSGTALQCAASSVPAGGHYALVAYPASPVMVEPGGTVTLMMGAAGASPADYVALFESGKDDRQFISVRSTGGLDYATMTFTAPATPGDYEFRYFKGGVQSHVATSNRVTVRSGSLFIADPPSVPAGGVSTLWWRVSGSTSVSIDGFDVGSWPFWRVSPTKTTTYTLTTTVNGAPFTASVTVTVEPPQQVEPPVLGVPTITSVTARSSSETVVVWTPSGTQAAAYQVLRNGSVVASVASTALSYIDTALNAGTTYLYTVKAVDATGRSSIASNPVSVTTPAAALSCPAPAYQAFTGCYYANTLLTGAPVLIRADEQLNFNWGYGSPAAAVPPANFSARWQGYFQLQTGAYAFNVIASDGIRVYIDGNIALDRWTDQPPRMYTFRQSLDSGKHQITVEYYARSSSATAQLSWQNTTPATALPPSVSSFSASPASIVAGQAATLTWAVTGATSVLIDNGVGEVSTVQSKVVAPATTTTYRLTASNAGGAVAASLTITVATKRDDQPPTTPQIISIAAPGSSEVSLQWSASTDNMGVSGYQVIRNGAVAATLGPGVLSYVDNTVSGNKTYTYYLKSFDAAGNYSEISTGMSVLTPSDPISLPTTCPAAAAGAFSACYYPNITLSGAPRLVRTDPELNFNWGYGSPSNSLQPGSFSARWQGQFTFTGGTYAFTAVTSDGMRVYVDGNMVLDRWRDQPASQYVFRSTLSSGVHAVTVEFYSHSFGATAQLRWTAD